MGENTGMPSETLIQIENVSKHYSTNPLKSALALDNVSLTVARGDVFGFLGPNGAGKTSLIKILVGIMTPDTGSARIAGLNSSTRAAKLRLGYLPERPYFHDFLTSAEFLKFHGRLVGLDDDVIDGRIPALLEKVGLKRARDQRLRTFSKGMLQRIGLAQSMLHEPEVLILDEPMSGLDPVGRREVRDLITEISMTGTTIFFSTHIIHDVEVICTSVGFIDKGKLKGLGNIEALLGKTVKSMEISFTLPFEKDPHKVQTLERARRTMEGWVIDIESAADKLEDEVNGVLGIILGEKGKVRAVIPRKSTLEDLFFGQSR